MNQNRQDIEEIRSTLERIETLLSSLVDGRVRLSNGGELLTTADVAERYGVNTDTVRGWIRGGLLRAINVARIETQRARYRISRDALIDFEKLRSDNGETPKPRRKRLKQRKQWV